MVEHHDIPWGRLRLRPHIDAFSLDLGLDRRPRVDDLGTCAKWNLVDGQSLLTIQDPSVSNISWLRRHAPDAKLAYLEVAIDLFPPAGASEAERAALLDETFLGLALRLDPIPAFLHGGPQTMRGYVRRGGDLPKPFDKVLPPQGSQLLYGHKSDPMQVVVYVKKVDQQRAIDSSRHCVRVELRLHRGMLKHHQLDAVGDLLGFDYRDAFGPMFRLIRGITPRAAAAPKNTLRRTISLWQAQNTWNGAGAGGTRKLDAHQQRKLRDSRANKRFGDALAQLTNAHRLKEICGFDSDGTSPSG